MNNLRISRIDILSNNQCKLKKADYKLANMIASIDVGKKRKNQEDAVLLISHPTVDEFKLLAVADGMGGLEQGEVASNFTLLTILEWFENLPEYYYELEAQVCLELNYKLHEIDFILRDSLKNAGTTLSVAIVCKNSTFLVNVGDSRIYTLERDSFIQRSEDHSISWNLYRRGIIPSKDDILFHRQKNLITSKLGGKKKNLRVFNDSLLNSHYEGIFLFTDGVTDVLTDKEIFESLSSKTDEIISRKIIDTALGVTKTNTSLDSDNYYERIEGGDDNMSVAILMKRK